MKNNIHIVTIKEICYNIISSPTNSYSKLKESNKKRIVIFIIILSYVEKANEYFTQYNML